MLKVKKTSKNKLIIYIIVISLMFIGTLFFVYKNYQLLHQKDLPIIFVDENNEPIINQKVYSNEAYESVNNDIANFEILNNENYKNLVNNYVEPLKIEPGNENIFEYYE